MLDERVLAAFHDELKTAALSPGLQGAISGGTAMAGLGGVIGGGVGAVRAYRQARSQGATRGEALLAAPGGVGKGALVGALAGGAGGALRGASDPQLGERLTSLGALGAPSRFMQRQVHGITGWTPTKGIESIRGGAWGAKEQVRNLASQGVTGKAKQKAVISANAAQKAQDMGLTSIPGYIGAVKEKGLGKVLSTGFKEQWHGGGIGTKALTVGIPTLSAVQAATAPEVEGAPGKAERIGRGILPAATGLVSGQIPFAGQMLIGTGAAAAGAGAGRLIDRARGRKSPSKSVAQVAMSPKAEMYPQASEVSEVRATPEAMEGLGVR